MQPGHMVLLLIVCVCAMCIHMVTQVQSTCMVLMILAALLELATYTTELSMHMHRRFLHYRASVE